MRHRSIPCPLCGSPVLRTHLTSLGLCIECKEARETSQEAAQEAAEAREAAAATLASTLYARAQEGRLAREKAAAEAARQKELAAQQKEVTAAQRELASRELARRSILHYAERRVPGYDPSWCHELVASQLEEFFRDIADKKSPRMILALPSRIGKSELASKCAPAWALGHWPHWRFVLASYSDVLPVEFSRSIRETLQDPDYHELFPRGARLSPDDASVKAWSTVQGGALRAVGVGGGLLGFGADCLIIDDPVKSTEEANNPEALNKLYDWFSSVAYSRQLPGAGILVIQQRMAVDDLVGRLLANQRNEEARLADLRKTIEELKAEENKSSDTLREIELLTQEAEELDTSMDRWRYLEYQAIATADEYYDVGKREIIRMPSGITPPEGPTYKPLRRQGEALHPRRYTRSFLLKIKRNNPKMFSAMYQLNPVADEGAYFSSTDCIRYERNHHPKLDQLHVFTAWDLAIGTKQANDYTVGVAGGLDHKGTLWLLDMVRGKFGDVRTTADLVIDLHKKWNSSLTGIEHNHIAMALGPILRARMAERNEFIVLAEGKERLLATSDKMVRARQLQGLARSGKFMVPDSEEFDEVVGELTRFGAGGHDDIVDALAWLAILALRQAPPPDPAKAHQNPVQRFVSWLDELYDEYSSQGSKSFMES